MFRVCTIAVGLVAAVFNVVDADISFGTISTAAGNGIPAYTGDGGAATASG